MAAQRTQVYLTSEQRRDLDAIAVREGTSRAELIRSAVDEYLDSRPADVDAVLAETFGAAGEAAAPSRAEGGGGRRRRLRAVEGMTQAARGEAPTLARIDEILDEEQATNEDATRGGTARRD